MALLLEELDDATRVRMHGEFLAEWGAEDHFVPASLDVQGVAEWEEILGAAIQSGDDATLAAALGRSGLIKQRETYPRNGRTYERTVNVAQRAEQLATSEFNTWYVRGLCARLLDEGVERVQVYRAAPAKYAVAGCSTHEGALMSTRVVYDGHRASYWPEVNQQAVSVPMQPGCHHSVRRHVEEEQQTTDD